MKRVTEINNGGKVLGKAVATKVGWRDPFYKPMKTKTPRRESHAKMMLVLARTRLARLNAGTAQLHEITIAAKVVERWKQALADESLPLIGKPVNVSVK